MTTTTPAPPPDLLLTVGEVAARWRVMNKGVYAAIDSGELPAIRLGPKTIRISQADLEAYEAAHRTPVPPLSERQRDIVRNAFESA